MPKISAFGLGEIKKISAFGLGQVKKVSAFGLGVIWSAFASSGMTRNASHPLTTTMAQVGGWVADPAYPDTVMSDGTGMTVNGGGGQANVTTSVPFTNSGISRTVNVELRMNGTLIASTSASLPSAGATITLNTAAPVTVPDGALFTYHASQSGGTVAAANSTAAYYRVIPVS